MSDGAMNRGHLLQNNFLSVVRLRRSLLRNLYGKSAKQGIEALEQLKQGAVRVPPNGVINHREFLKHGGIRQALADFMALQPEYIRGVSDPGQVSTRVGSVGDRTVYISSGEGSGRASVTVVKSWNDYDTEVDKFIYLD